MENCWRWESPPKRIEVIKLLAAQVSISIENAGLYEDQSRLIRGAAAVSCRASSWTASTTTTSRASTWASTAPRAEYHVRGPAWLHPARRAARPSSRIELLNRYFASMEPRDLASGWLHRLHSRATRSWRCSRLRRTAVRAGIGMWRRSRSLTGARARRANRTANGDRRQHGPVVLGTVGARTTASNVRSSATPSTWPRG